MLQDAYVNSFFSCTARILNSLPIEYFPLTYGLNGFKSRISRHLLTVDSFETDFLHAWIFLCIFFLVTPSFVVAVQACIEWIPIFLFKKRNCWSDPSSEDPPSWKHFLHQVRVTKVVLVFVFLSATWLPPQSFLGHCQGGSLLSQCKSLHFCYLFCPEGQSMGVL